jgi:putative hydrolase of HD superfamily
MQSSAILGLIQELQKLKLTPRSGWQIRGITHAESVADHTYRMSVLSMVLADALRADGLEIDTERVIRMALIHEFGEAYIGDIPYPAMRFLTAEMKYSAEQNAVAAMVENLGEVGQLYLRLWHEFETGQTLEAQLVRACDKLEMMIQVDEYESVGYQCLKEFWNVTGNRAYASLHPVIGDILQIIETRHRARHSPNQP